ncbi:MAG: WG repeat-containing protein [Clostridium sp.]|nr:WG repeat-containing protein [Clostridium sp.]
MEKLKNFNMFDFLKKCICLIALIAASLIVSKAEMRSFVTANGYVYFENEGNIYNYKKELIIPSSRGYGRVRFYPSPAFGGFFIVTKNGLEGICDLSGKEIVKPKYKYIFSGSDVDISQCMYFFVNGDSKVGIDGKEYKHGDDHIFFNLQNGFYYFDKNYKIKSIGKVSKSYVKEFWRLHEFAKDIEKTRNLKENESKKSQQLMVNDSPLSEKNQNGFAWVRIKDRGRQGVADGHGNIIIPAIYEKIKFWKLTDDLACFKCLSLDNVKVFTLTGTKILETSFPCDELEFEKDKDIIGYFKYLRLCYNGKLNTGLYDISGSELLSPVEYGREYDDAKIERGRGDEIFIKVYKGNKEGAYDIHGRRIIEPKKSKTLIYDSTHGFAYAGDYYMGIKLMPDGSADFSQKNMWDEEKRQRRAQLWANILEGAAMGLQQSYAMMQYNSMMTAQKTNYQTGGTLAEQMSQPGYFQNAFNQIMVVSAFQVQQQEMQRFENTKRAMNRPDMTYSEYCLLQGQAIENLRNQGYDIIAEQKKIYEDSHNAFVGSLTSGKDNVTRIHEQNEAKYGTSSSSSTSYASEPARKPTNSTNSLSSAQNNSSSSTSHSNISHSTATETNDAHVQYQAGKLNTNSDDYTKIKNILLYLKDGSGYKKASQFAELYKKGSNRYVKIGGSFFLVQGSGRNEHIIYGSTPYYLND